MGVVITVAAGVVVAALGSCISWIAAGGRRNRVLDLANRELQVVNQLSSNNPHRAALQRRVDDQLAAYVAAPAAINRRRVKMVSYVAGYSVALVATVLWSAELNATVPEQIGMGAMGGAGALGLAAALRTAVTWFQQNHVTLPSADVGTAPPQIDNLIIGPATDNASLR